MAKIKLNIRQDEQITLDAHQLKHYATITELKNWQELLDAYVTLKEKVAPKRVFLVLDDVAQAEYTSMHAVEDERLYFDIHEYLKDVDTHDPKFEQIYQNVCLPKELQHYVRQLSDIENQKSFESIAEKMRHYDEQDLEALVYFNQDLSISIDTEIMVKVADIETEVLKLAIMPNGYFSCDFDPFENFAIIQKMQHYGFEFMGLGAALLGWMKTSDFKEDKIDNLIQDLTLIYPLNSMYKEKMKALILRNNYLILPYSESPQEYLDYDL